VLLHVAQLRSETGRAAPRDVQDLFLALAITPPSKISNVLSALEDTALAARGRGQGSVWSLSPRGRDRLSTLELSGDLPALFAESNLVGSSSLGGAQHPLLPMELAPPDIALAIRRFVQDYPFETNVFGMTRFPNSDPHELDPVMDAIQVARDACDRHGLKFHLASDRAIVDDLWGNVAAHMWASKYGMAFFEDRQSRGVNYNMTIEVGAMLMAGRRCALLKDASIMSLPSDLVGKIYRSVDLQDLDGVAASLHRWLRDDLRLRRCSACPAN
jgi:hypothetical protein